MTTRVASHSSAPHSPADVHLRRRAALDTPVGRLLLTEENGALVTIDWINENRSEVNGSEAPANGRRTPTLPRALRLLERYFAGEPVAFDLPLAPAGTSFQQRVWMAMRAIPPGETVTYGELARRLGSEPRAVGGACGANPLPIVIPCHRVVAANGAGGYSGCGGLATKARLLALENGQAPLPFRIAPSLHL